MQLLLHAFVLAVAVALSAGAEIYTWQDGNGVTHFTDDPAAIPKKASRVKVRDSGDQRQWKYYNTLYGTDFYFDPASVAYLRKDRYRVVVKEQYRRESYEKTVEIDCNRMRYREALPHGDEDEDDGYNSGFIPLDEQVRALSRYVCR